MLALLRNRSRPFAGRAMQVLHHSAFAFLHMNVMARSPAMLLSLAHQLGLTFCPPQEIRRICKIAPYCSAPLPVTYSCMLKMASCYTGREYIQARLRAYKPGILAWVRPVAQHISKSVHVKSHFACLITLLVSAVLNYPSFPDCIKFESRSET